MHAASPRRPTPAARLAAAVALALATGCWREEVTHFRVPKEASGSALARPGGMAMGAPGAGAEVPPPPAPSGGSALKWKLPKGWTESLTGGMRYATLKPAVPGRIDVSVVVLPGPAGGELANVNRWRGQIGLSPVEEPALAGMRRTLRTGAGPVSVYEFTGEGEKKSSTIAGLAFVEGNTWFVKMTGDAGAVGSAKPEFMNLLESLHLE